MFAHLPNHLDTETACEFLQEGSEDSTVLVENALALARVATFLRGLYKLRCARCQNQLGTPSAWIEQIERAARDERSSSAGCRNIMRDIVRRTRGFCSHACEIGPVSP